MRARVANSQQQKSCTNETGLPLPRNTGGALTQERGATPTREHRGCPHTGARGCSSAVEAEEVGGAGGLLDGRGRTSRRCRPALRSPCRSCRPPGHQLTQRSRRPCPLARPSSPSDRRPIRSQARSSPISVSCPPAGIRSQSMRPGCSKSEMSRTHIGVHRVRDHSVRVAYRRA